MTETTFFNTQTISSRVKAGIVSEYFPSYSKIIIKKFIPKAVRFIDLFSGPGKYEDGNESTPLLLARKCHGDPILKDLVKFIFNDNVFSSELEKNFLNEFPDNSFKYKPHFGKGTVGENVAIDTFLKTSTHKDKRNQYPSVLFIDPFGYKGIKTEVLAKFLENWGNEVFIFVNTKRIQAALENDKFEGLMRDLFPKSFEKVRVVRRFRTSVSERLAFIIDSLAAEFKILLNGTVYHTAFKFQEEDVETTSHYILHITKGVKGFELIKTVYNDFANVGTIFDGINTYTFDPKRLDSKESELFDISSLNIDNLKQLLKQQYKGITISSQKLYENHHPNTTYARSHYTEALCGLVDDGVLNAKFNDNINHKKNVIITDKCILKFKNE